MSTLVIETLDCKIPNNTIRDGETIIYNDALLNFSIDHKNTYMFLKILRPNTFSISDKKLYGVHEYASHFLTESMCFFHFNENSIGAIKSITTDNRLLIDTICSSLAKISSYKSISNYSGFFISGDKKVITRLMPGNPRIQPYNSINFEYEVI